MTATAVARVGRVNEIEAGGKVSETRSSTPVRRGDDKSRTSPTTFYRQVVAELRKVVWPTQQQVVTYFLVVLAFVLVMMTIVAGLDYGLGKLVFAIFG